MKRELKADKEIKLRAPTAPRAQERELSDIATYMVEQISKRFRNQALEGLNKGTVEKFADARQTGNYARVFIRLARSDRQKLLRQFSDDRIEKLVEKIGNKISDRNRKELYGLVEKRIGINSTELSNTEGLLADMNALNLETAQWVKKLRDETLEMYTANSLRAMTHGESLEEIMSQFDGMVEKRKNHAKFTARNQIANFNSMATKMRAQNLGITKAVWITSKDERVRECHKRRDGKEFELDKGLYSACDGQWLLPGTDYQCRCDYMLIVPEE